MKKTVRMFSLLLALILGLSVCCAGLAEGSAEQAEAEQAMAYFQYLMNMPGMEGIDWEGFYAGLAEKMASGAEITLEDCCPGEAWNAVMSMMFMDPEDGHILTEEERGFAIETTANVNEITSLFTWNEQVSEEGVKQISESVSASFESEETKQKMLESFTQMGQGVIDVSTVKLTLKFVNADGSVIYEKSYTQEDLPQEAEPAA